MRLNIVESKNAKQLYIIKSCRINGKNTSKIVEKLGTYENLLKEHDDPIAWGKERAAELTRLEKEQMRSVSIDFKQDTLISSGERKSFNCGYLFLEHIYHSLGLHKICKTITKKYKFEYNLDSILSRLIYSRIIFPSSKLSTFQMSKNFLEKPEFELNQIYRSLDVLASETDFIQSELYKNSKKLSKRNDRIL
ncbi:transposase, partial [Bacillus licheniformis]